MRNAPTLPTPTDQENTFSLSSLKQQEKIIKTVLLYGNPEEKRKLDAAEADSQLHPLIKSLIQKCRTNAAFYSQRTSDTGTTSIKEQIRSNGIAA